MQKYIGCKIIQAKPMNSHEFLGKVRNLIPAKNQKDQPGHLVQYPDGYVSWFPKEIFETAYRLVTPPEYELLKQDDDTDGLDAIDG